MGEVLVYNNPAVPDWIEVFYAPIRDSVAIDVALIVVLLLIIIDMITGMVQASINGVFDSTKVRQGLAHKCSEFVFIAIGILVDALLYVGVDLDLGITFSSPVTMVIITAIILMEIASILENLMKINPSLAELPVFNVLLDPVLKHAHGGKDTKKTWNNDDKENENED